MQKLRAAIAPLNETSLVRRVARRVAFTRQGALSLARRLPTDRALGPITRTIMVLLGSAFIGLGITLFLRARLGLPPYDVLLSAISGRTSLSHGQAGWLTAVLFYSLAALLGERANRWTILFVLGNGVAIDALNPLIAEPQSLGGRWIFAVGGILSIAIAIAVVAHTTSTGGSFELLTKAAERRGLSPTRFRTGLELSIVGLGVALGGTFGGATALFAVAIGAALAVVSQGLADHQQGRAARLAPPEDPTRPLFDDDDEFADWHTDLSV